MRTPPHSRLFGAVGAIALALIATIVGTNLFFLGNLRENTLQTAETSLARYSLTLAENADRSFKSVDLVLSSVADYIARKGVIDDDTYHAAVSDRETHFLLREKIAGLPQIDALTVIDASGKLLNFSRYWPIPDVDISDRDYFKALKADDGPQSFVSAPVQNRGNGTWNVYLARRLNDPQGHFISVRSRCRISRISSARPRSASTPPSRWCAKTGCCWRIFHRTTTSATNPRASASARSPLAERSARSAARTATCACAPPGCCRATRRWSWSRNRRTMRCRAGAAWRC
jgi:hypothetical protein